MINNDNQSQEKLLLSILNDNRIEKIPQTPLEVNNIEVVLALWENCRPKLSIDDEYLLRASYVNEWYQKNDWKQILSHYNDNYLFWDKAIQKFQYKLLLDKNFKKDFPTVVDYYLKDNNFLESIFNKTKNKDFFELISKTSEEKDIIYTNYLNSAASSIVIEDIRKYQDVKEDVSFIKKALSKNPDYYKHLNERNKENLEFIRLAIVKRENYYKIPENLKSLFFVDWYNRFKQEINPKEIPFFTLEQQERILMERPILLIATINSGQKQYYHLIKKVIDKDLKTIDEFDLKHLMSSYANENDIGMIRVKVEKFIENYQYLGCLRERDQKLAYIASLDEQLNQKLKENIYIQINDCIYGSNKKELTNTIFENFFEILLKKQKDNKIKPEEIEELLIKARKKLSITDLIENRYPKKDLFKYMQTRKLYKGLENSLDQKIPGRKIKI